MHRNLRLAALSFVVGCAGEPFQAEPAAPAVQAANGLVSQWSILDLGASSDRVAYGINNNDQVVGERSDPNGHGYPIIGGRGAPWRDLVLPAGFSDGTAFSINNRGVVAGWVVAEDGQSTRAAAWTPDGRVTLPNGDAQPPFVLLQEINDDNLAVGSGQFPGQAAGSGFTWSLGSRLVPLPPLVVGRRTSAFSLNNHGVVVGVAVDSSGLSVPVYWTKNRTIRRIPLPGGFSSALARAINDRGQVAGYTGGSASVVWRWSERTGTAIMPLPAGATRAFTFAIDAAGRVFGVFFDTATGRDEPFVWTESQVLRLPTLGGGGDAMWAANMCGRSVGNQYDSQGQLHVVIYDRQCP